MNTIQAQFKQALDREGKSITGYFNQISTSCLFRKINDNNNTTNHIQIFYSATEPIEQGQLLSYKDQQFVTLNKESVENETYFKSNIVQCNTSIVVIKDNEKNIIPAYSGDLISPLPDVNKIISVVGGNLELITECNETTKKLAINDIYKILNGTYKIVNVVYINGLTHIYVERTTSSDIPIIYTFNFTLDTNYSIGDIQPLSMVATDDGQAYTNIENVIWSVSDDSLATITNDTVTFLDCGEVTITGTYNGITTSVTTTVKTDAPPVVLVNILSDRTTFPTGTKLGTTYNWSCTILNEDGTLPELTKPVFTVDTTYSGKIILIDNKDGTATTKVGTYTDTTLLGEEYILTCTDAISGFYKSISLTIVGLY